MGIAIFSTWTTYGTWLPGDQRGWFKRNRGLCDPSSFREFAAALRMSEDALFLSPKQRRIAEETIRRHCDIREWELHAVTCRTNHVHVVVTAPGREIHIPREQFKSWCTRRLKEYDSLQSTNSSRIIRENWWTERGWDEYIDNDKALAEVVAYVLERQGE